MTNFNLCAWCTKFIDSNYNDVKLMEIAALVRKEAKSNGYTDDDVSEMYRTINKERNEHKEIREKAPQATTESNEQEPQSNEAGKAANRRTEPNRKSKRTFNNDNTDSVRSPSGTRARKTESMILKMIDERK